MFKSKRIPEKSKIDGFLYVPTRMFELRLKNMTIKIFTLARTNRFCVFDQKKYLTSNKKNSDNLLHNILELYQFLTQV